MTAPPKLPDGRSDNQFARAAAVPVVLFAFALWVLLERSRLDLPSSPAAIWFWVTLGATALAGVVGGVVCRGRRGRRGVAFGVLLAFLVTLTVLLLAVYLPGAVA